jgi:MFS family permease
MTATRTLPSPVQSAGGRSWSALAVLMIGTFMFVLDFFIVNVALPSIQHGLGAGESAIEWIVVGYAISTAVLLVTGGRLGDQFGRRRMFAIGLTVFILTSAACALAPDPAVLAAARARMRVAGAADGCSGRGRPSGCDGGGDAVFCPGCHGGRDASGRTR